MKFWIFCLKQSDKNGVMIVYKADLMTSKLAKNIAISFVRVEYKHVERALEQLKMENIKSKQQFYFWFVKLNVFSKSKVFYWLRFFNFQNLQKHFYFHFMFFLCHQKERKEMFKMFKEFIGFYHNLYHIAGSNSLNQMKNSCNWRSSHIK